jgi:oligosaccharide repeat unit polymerase
MMIGIVGAARSRVRRAQAIEGFSMTQAVRSFSRTLDIYQPFAMVVDAFPSRSNFLYGASFTFLLVQPIPRAIWPGKPAPPIRRIIAAAFQDPEVARAGIFYPNVGEYYANFGLPGAIVGMFLFGVLARAIYEYLLRYPDNPWVIVFFSMSLPYLVQIVSRGYFVQIVVETVFILLPVVLGMWVIDRRSLERQTA